MKRKIWATGMSLTVLVAMLGGNVVTAQAATTVAAPNPVALGNPVQSNNAQFKGLKSPHSSRKAAAKRLKVLHKQKMQSRLKALSAKGQAGVVK